MAMNDSTPASMKAPTTVRPPSRMPIGVPVASGAILVTASMKRLEHGVVVGIALAARSRPARGRRASSSRARGPAAAIARVTGWAASALRIWSSMVRERRDHEHRRRRASERRRALGQPLEARRPGARASADAGSCAGGGLAQRRRRSAPGSGPPRRRWAAARRRSGSSVRSSRVDGVGDGRQLRRPGRRARSRRACARRRPRAAARTRAARACAAARFGRSASSVLGD